MDTSIRRVQTDQTIATSGAVHATRQRDEDRQMGREGRDFGAELAEQSGEGRKRRPAPLADMPGPHEPAPTRDADPELGGSLDVIA